MKGIGLVTLSTDPVGEDAFKGIMAGTPLRVFTTRTGYDEENHEAGGFIPRPDWPVLLATLPPDDLIDVIVFLCTSATIALGNDELIHRLSSGRPGLQYTSPGMAAVAMMKAFNIKRIALLTPYGPTLHNAFAPYLARYGIEVVADLSLAHSMNLVTDDDIGRVPVNRIEAELSQLLGNAQPVDAAFVSCAAFSVKQSDLVEMTEALGCPVLASVHSTAWHVLDLVGEHGLRDKFALDLGLPRLSQPTISVSDLE
ncbi:aspartate racemase/maleate isomerase family protein (plasmid) [Rhizobium leguminosarum]